MKYQVLTMGPGGVPGPPGPPPVLGRGPPGAGASREARAGLSGACRDGTLLRIAPPGGLATIAAEVTPALPSLKQRYPNLWGKMLDRPGHKADSDPRYDGGQAPNARSPRRNPGGRRRGAERRGGAEAGAHRGNTGARGRPAGARR